MSNRAVFIDRDGTLLEHYDYLTDPSQVELLPRSAAALRLLRDRGFLLVMITNQSAVARGMLSEAKLQDIHTHLKGLLAKEGAYLDEIYYCPYHPEGSVVKYRRESELRKPAPGMLHRAAEELDIDLSQSWAVGDDDRDVQAGQAAGCRTILLEQRGRSELVHRGKSKPDFTAVNLQEAANTIVRYGDKRGATDSDEGGAGEEEGESKADKKKQEPEALPNGEENEVQPQTGRQGGTNQDQNSSVSLRLQEVARRRAEKHRPTAGEREDRAEDDAAMESGGEESEVLLRQILRELKTLNRHQHFEETDFSIPKLLAGVVQLAVLACLILAVAFGIGPESKSDTVHSCLFLAMIFQTLTLTLLIVHRGG